MKNKILDPFGIDSHKIHYHYDRLFQWDNFPQHTFPLYVEISPVGYCNHRCTFCAVDYIGYVNKRIDQTVLGKTLCDLSTEGIKSVMFAGEGEPLLHPNIIDLTNIAHEVGLDVAFTTNGVALTQKFVKEALNSVKWVKVSCNAGDPRTYAQIHKTKFDDFSKVWDNLRFAVKHKQENTVIGVQSLLLPENVNSLENLIKLAKETKLDYVVIKPYSQHKMSITKEYENIKYKEYIDLLNRLQNTYNSDTFKVIARFQAMNDWDKEDHSYEKCLSTPYFWAYIMASGDVYGCSAYLLDDKFNYGNINTHSFREIWLGDKRKASMEYIEKELNISECRKNCRMNQVNKYLWDLKKENPHKNFI